MSRLHALALSAVAFFTGCATQKVDLTNEPASHAAPTVPLQPSVKDIRDKMKNIGINVTRDDEGCLVITLPNGTSETNCDMRHTEEPAP